MTDQRKLEYFLLRYVPNVVREEFVNIGLIMTELDTDSGFAGSHMTSDWRRARAIDPNIDTEMLEAFGREVARRLSDPNERAALLFQMNDSFSNLVQLSPTEHTIAEDPARELNRLASELIEMPAVWAPDHARSERTFGRRWLHAGMTEAFRSAGIWDSLQKDLPAAPYTNPSDPFRFDFGYAVEDEIKLFHAVSLVEVSSETRMFPLRVAKISPRMEAARAKKPRFTAVVENDYNAADEAVATVLAFMHDEQIRVARLQEMTQIAETARIELAA